MPPQICDSIVFTRLHWRIRLNLCFRRSTRVHNPNGKSIDSANFAQLMRSSSGMPRHILSPNNSPLHGDLGAWKLFFHPSFYWINTLCISGYKIIGWHRKQHYGKSWLCYSDHIKTWLSKDRAIIFTLAKVKTVGKQLKPFPT